MRVSRSIYVRNRQHLFYNMCFWQIFENNSIQPFKYDTRLHINNVYDTLDKYTNNANNIPWQILLQLLIHFPKLERFIEWLQPTASFILLLIFYQVDINFNPLLCHYRTRFVCYVFVHSIHLFNQPISRKGRKKI